MLRALGTAGVALLAISAGVYQLHLKPILVQAGVGRVLSPVGNTNCKTVPELPACEKLVIHQPTGVVYLACSTQVSRKHWLPAVNRLNATGRSSRDFVAIYDPAYNKGLKLKVTGFSEPRGLSLHGMDVVPSASDPTKLWVYLVNHRSPLGDAKAEDVGADSVIEVFTTTVGGSTLDYVRTVEDPVIITPNDIIGSADGKSFHFTNDHGQKTGWVRQLDTPLKRAVTSVGYCHVDEGCKFAVQHLPGSNGIAQDQNGVVYVGNSRQSEIRVLEKQADNTLVVTDVLKYDRMFDNLAVDADGALWAAGLPDALQLIGKHFEDPFRELAPSSAIRVTLNTGESSFYGEKYKIEKLFEDDGHIACGSTTAAYDSQRNRLFLTGIASPHLTVCTL